MNHKINSIEQIKEKIFDLEESLNVLKDQLKEQEEELQHKAIDNLEKYLLQVDNKYENLRDFWPMVVSEIKELWAKKSN